MAAHTSLPVIGIPVSSGTLGGIDALLAVTQMPPGVPVGSVGIDGARNAALLAVRILALIRPELGEELRVWRAKEAEGVRASRSALDGLPCPPEETLERQ